MLMVACASSRSLAAGSPQHCEVQDEEHDHYEANQRAHVATAGCSYHA